eukprot:Blabericola_migrator_1__9552@NODE_51_length_16309_cov_78_132619_g47_i0_p7_GENE_NODE_51_length_16309_cov_78_132619_g47_i0NODE_51_length_16309_cov_78_132619_g47_i0_p7_ORF_typecomplete_len118_score6_12_NODE_51_length_16309_cov_78_132619_g47_i0172525
MPVYTSQSQLRYPTQTYSAPTQYTTQYTAQYQGAPSGYSQYYSSGAASPSVQYTSDPAHRYTPSGCSPVHSYPFGLNTIYSTGLVPAFMAPAQVRVSQGNLFNAVTEQATTTTVMRG